MKSRGGGTCDNLGGGGAEKRAIATWDCGQVHVAIYIYLVALHVCNDSFIIKSSPLGEKIS